MKNEFKNDLTFKDMVKTLNKVKWGQGKWFATCNYCPTKYTNYFHNNHDNYSTMGTREVRKYEARG
jgi:hypothetical protein